MKENESKICKVEELVVPLCIKNEDEQYEGANHEESLDRTATTLKSSLKIEADSPENNVLLNLVGSIDQKFDLDVLCKDGLAEKKPSANCSIVSSSLVRVYNGTTILAGPFPSDLQIKVENEYEKELEAFPNYASSSVSSSNTSYGFPETELGFEVHGYTHSAATCTKKEFEPAPLIKIVKLEENASESDEPPVINVFSDYGICSNFSEENSGTKRLRLSSSDGMPSCHVVLERINTSTNTVSCNISCDYKTKRSLKARGKSSISLVQDNIPFASSTRDCMTVSNSKHELKTSCGTTHGNFIRTRNKAHGKNVARGPETVASVNQDKATHKSDMCAWKLKGKETQNKKAFSKKISGSTSIGNSTQDNILDAGSLDYTCSDSVTYVALKFRCETCKTLFSRKEYVKRHILHHCEGASSVSNDPGSSQECAYGYYNRGSRRVGGFGDQRAQCKECGNYYSRHDVLLKHIKRVHKQPKVQKQVNLSTGENSGVSFTCNNCQKNFSSKSRLQVHHYHRKRMQLSERVCDTCHTFFTNSYSFNRHMRWVHRRDVEISRRARGPKQCEGCGNFFTRYSDLTKHLKRPGIRNWKCDAIAEVAKTDSIICKFCDKFFSSEGFLKCHLLRRYKQHTQVCQLCCEFFEDPQQLVVHSQLFH